MVIVHIIRLIETWGAFRILGFRGSGAKNQSSRGFHLRPCWAARLKAPKNMAVHVQIELRLVHREAVGSRASEARFGACLESPISRTFKNPGKPLYVKPCFIVAAGG